MVFVKCAWCGNEISRLPSKLKKLKHSFCDPSCQAAYRRRERQRKQKDTKEVNMIPWKRLFPEIGS